MATELNNRLDNTTDFLQEHARDAMILARQSEGRIQANGVVDLKNPRLNIDLNKPNIEAPPKFSDLFPDADGTSEEVARLNGEVDKWLADYFPSINDCFKNVPDEWLCNIISGTEAFGLHESVFEAIWHNSRDREERQYRSEEASLRADFSARGFSLPPGAMAVAMDKARQRASEAVQEVNRTESIRNEEVKLQLLQFAVQEAGRYKLAIMSSLAEFYRIWTTIPDKDIERARVRAQAYSSLYSALSAYYNVEISFEELRLRAASGDVDAQLASDSNKIALNNNTGVATAIGNAVRGFSDISASSANAAGSLIAQIESV
jgi:hypothetical protein